MKLVGSGFLINVAVIAVNAGIFFHYGEMPGLFMTCIGANAFVAGLCFGPLLDHWRAA